MPNNRGTFQGNLAGTGSRILEMLTSSKAVTASYAVTASRLSVNGVGQLGQPVYFQNGVPVADTKTQDIVTWVTANSGSISGATGSSAATNIQVKELVDKSGSWESASTWVEDNSSSVSNITTKVNNLKGISFATGATRITASYHPTSSQVIINIPSNPGHIGAASASHNHTFAQITDGTAISASVKRLEVSASSIKNSYVTTASFNNFTQSVASGFLPLGGGTLTGSLQTQDVFISGNLFVSGTTTTINAENLNIKDKLILVASGSTSQAAANGAGIAVPTASAGEGGAARIQYLSSGNKFTSSVAFEAPSFTGSLKGTASNAVSASYSTQAGASISASYATSASHAKNSDKATSASYASASTTASYALVAESVKDASGLVVNTASYALGVDWNNVAGHPTFVSATFRTGTFSPATYNPVGSAQTINIPTTTDHIAGLNAITRSVKLMVESTASWDGVASTASAAYQSASKALATASVAQKEAESASYWKTEASKSAANASTYAGEASGSMEDARLYSSQAANNATLSSTSAQLAAASASAAASSATSAATYATRAQQSASNAHTSKTLAAASASAAAASASAASSSAATAANWAVSASASANQIQADTTVAANWAASSSKYATNASESAALMYKNVGSATQPVFMSASVGPIAATPYESASVKEAVTASNVVVGAVNTNANLPVLIAAAATPANPGPVKYDTNLTYNASTNRLNAPQVNSTGVTASVGRITQVVATGVTASGAFRGNLVGNVTGNLTGTASFATSASRAISAASADSATSATSASYAVNSTTASYALIAEAVKDGAGLVVNTASYALDAAIKFDGHYAPSSSGAGTSGSSTARYYVKTIKVDGKGHVVGVTTGNETVTNTDTKVTAVGNHYTPTQSTGKAASAGSVISGLGLDAAGHVVSITGSSTIASATSASYATNATSASYSTYAGNAGQLAGKAASQYALASDYLPLGGGTITGSLTVQKDLVVAGTASYLYTNDLVVKDRLILVSSGSTTQANSDGAGIAIQTASATTVANAEKAAARFQYRSSDNKFTASVGIVAPDFTGNLTGTASYATKAGSAASATTASYITWANVGGKPSSFTPAAHNHNLLVTEGDYRATASTPNDYVNNFRFRGLKNTSTIGLTIGTGSYAYVLGLRGWSDSSGGDSHELAFNNAGIFTRHGATTSWGSWVKVITSDLTSSWATAAANNHTHSNKAVLDGISAADTASWDAKQAAISDLTTIRSNATNGNTAYGWGNHANAGYVKSSGVTSIATGTGLTGGPITSTGTMSIAAATLGKIESGSTAFGWGNHANAGYAKPADITSAINALVTASGSKWSTDNDTKVTSAANHYTPAKAGTSGSSTARYYIKTIDVDAKGHVTGVTTGNETVTNTDTKVTAVGNHYTPAQSAGKSVSAGQVMTGVGVDAAGHVVSVTGSSTVASASRADLAESAKGPYVGYNFSTGYLVTTNITGSESTMLRFKIEGNSYKATESPINTDIQFYSYNNSELIAASGKHNGFDFGDVTAMVYQGYVCLWFQQPASYMTFAVSCQIRNSTGRLEDCVTAITNAAKPTSNVQRSITITPRVSADSVNLHTHSNKSVLDEITADKTASWDAAKPGTVTSVTLTTSSNYVVVDSVAAITTSGTRKIDLTETTKGKIESGSSAFEGNTIPYVESSVHSGTISLTRGQYKNCGVLTGDVTFNFANDFGTGRGTIYAGKFYWGPSQGYSVTFPSSVSWLDSSVDLEVQGWYEFNILDNIGIMASLSDNE